MRFLTLVLLGYGCAMLILRENISATVTVPGGMILLDFMISVSLATAFGMVMVQRSTKHATVSNATAFGSSMLVGITILGAIQVTSERTHQPIAALAAISAEAQLDRAWDGHFRAIAQIDGADVGLMVDTGASIVLLRYDDALRIGIDPANLDYSIPLTTAGGRSFVAPYVFGTIRIGDVTVHNVEGAIAQRRALHSSLLGMSYLEQLTETVIRGDGMIFRQ